MKKIITKIICAAITLSLALTMCGCGNNEGQSGTSDTNVEVSADTIGGKYVIAFNSSNGTDVNAIVDEIIAQNIGDFNLAKMDVEPGYLNGFDEEIKGFEEGVMFAPMIGSIPFVGYVLKTGDTAALIKELEASANMRWNVCTEADEQVNATKGDYVFFLMCTNEE